MRQGIVVGDQAIAQLESHSHCLLGLRAPEPRPMWGRMQDAVHAHGRHEDGHLEPPRQQRRVRLPGEASGVAPDIWGARQHPIQHHSRRLGELVPSRIYITRPDRRPESSHPRAPSAVQGVEPLVALRLAQGVQLGGVPKMKCEVVRLAFVVPPETHAIFDKALQVVAVPSPDVFSGVIEASLLRIHAREVRRPTSCRLTTG
mmetsp:Transcript_65233/g.187839  ORF Transcript_65233/g.187839 Transcript_65233/m.187839 type:complete len:202 (+) Transcript_65233:690-1295(+)